MEEYIALATLVTFAVLLIIGAWAGADEKRRTEYAPLLKVEFDPTIEEEIDYANEPVEHEPPAIWPTEFAEHWMSTKDSFRTDSFRTGQ